VATTVLFGILVVAPGAHGQAAVDQYVPAPEPRETSSAPPAGEPGPPGAITPGGAREAKGIEITATSDGSGGGVELPVSDGYPVTPFVVLIVILLACGIVARLVLGGMRRKENSV
jgi:hypothetical protein